MLRFHLERVRRLRGDRLGARVDTEAKDWWVLIGVFDTCAIHDITLPYLI